MDYTNISKHETRRNNNKKAKNSKHKTIISRQKNIINNNNDINYWKSYKFFKKDTNNDIAIIKEFCFKDNSTVFCMPAVKRNKPAKRFNKPLMSVNYYNQLLLEM